MNRQANHNLLTVHSPIPRKQLGRYRNIKGTYIIRHQEKVLYIGSSTNIYKAASRLFQQSGALARLDMNLMNFEIIRSNLRRPSLETTFKLNLAPVHNYKKKPSSSSSCYERKQMKRIMTAYYEQSRFAPEKEVYGEPKTDPTL
jgi:hypothetical protein